MFVGLAGYARSGKDEAATALVARGFKRIALADSLRQILYITNPVVPMHGTINPYAPTWVIPLRELVDDKGWDEAKANAEVRRLLQVLGTDACRHIISDNVWVDTALGHLHPGENIVVTDVRFANEAQAIQSKGGYVIKIERPGVGPANNHISESALDNADFDKVIINDGTINQLHNKLLEFVETA